MSNVSGVPTSSNPERRHCNVVISQPMYFPWPGFFEQMALADIYIWLDDAQFSKGSFTNRVQVKLDAGVKWLTVPLAGKGTMMRICDLKASVESWALSHHELLRQSLRPYRYHPQALDIFARATTGGSVVNRLIASAEEPAEALNIRPKKVLRSSEFGVSGRSWKRVLDLVKAVGGTHYITGHGAARYLDHSEFERQGISVQYMDYSLTAWSQHHGVFTPYVTVLDLIAATGGAAGEYIRPRIIPWRSFLEMRGLPI